MAFDFSGSKRPKAPSSGGSRNDIDYTSSDSTPRPSSGSTSASGGFSGFQNRPTGFQDKPSGFQDRPANEPARQSGFQNKPSGFQNRPESKAGTSGNTSLTPVNHSPARSAPRAPVKRPATHRRGVSNDFGAIPWNVVLPIIGLIALVILCVVFREAITEFLVQVLTWIIMILVIIFLVKWLIFGGRRR